MISLMNFIEISSAPTVLDFVLSTHLATSSSVTAANLKLLVVIWRKLNFWIIPKPKLIALFKPLPIEKKKLLRMLGSRPTKRKSLKAEVNY